MERRPAKPWQEGVPALFGGSPKHIVCAYVVAATAILASGMFAIWATERRWAWAPALPLGLSSFFQVLFFLAMRSDPAALRPRQAMILAVFITCLALIAAWSIANGSAQTLPHG